ncbi:MAG: hypothetical protein IIA73_02650 [Proteobacteria bacterium]|nr:hypothetical protein [Pseudomonadota bacterium]
MNSSAHDPASRRAVLGAAVAAVTGGLALRWLGPARAQVLPEPRLLESILRNEGAARLLHREVIAAKAPLDEGFLKHTVDREIELRFDLEQFLANLPAAARQPLVRFEHESLAAQMLEYKVQLVPGKELIKPLSVLELDDKRQDDDPVDVLIDIVLESFLDRATIEGLRALIREDTVLRNLGRRIVDLIRAGRWLAVAEWIVRYVERMASAGFLRTVAKRLGLPAARRVLISISTRFVPFVGWVYWAIALGVAIKRNAHRFG